MKKCQRERGEKRDERRVGGCGRRTEEADEYRESAKCFRVGLGEDDRASGVCEFGASIGTGVEIGIGIEAWSKSSADRREEEEEGREGERRGERRRRRRGGHVGAAAGERRGRGGRRGKREGGEGMARIKGKRGWLSGWLVG